MIKSILTTPPYSSGGGADSAVCNNTGRKTGSCSKEFQVLKLRQKVDVDIRRMADLGGEIRADSLSRCTSLFLPGL